MLILSKIRRKHGTTIVMDNRTYQFRPVDPGGPHICEVASPAHAQRFLGIPEGFAIFTENEDHADAHAPATAVAPLEPTVVDSDAIDNMSALEAVATPTDAPGAVDAPPAGVAPTDPVHQQQSPDATAPAAPQAPLDDAPSAPAQAPDLSAETETGDTIDAMDEPSLRAAYEKLNGRAAPANARIDTLRERVRELAAE